MPESPRQRLEPIRSVEQAVEFLLGLVRDNPRPGSRSRVQALYPIRQLLERVGNPQHGLATIHIAGSKGKGSTALYLEQILQTAGYRTGTFTSPHLQRWTERYRIAGREIDGTQLADTLERLRPHINDQVRRTPDLAPSFFAAATAAALDLFRSEAVDFAIIETGIGGRRDATNVVRPRVSCITTLELEHTDKLGDTLLSIAEEKAGIIKPGVPVVTGRLPEVCRAVIERRCARLRCRLTDLGGALHLKQTWRAPGELFMQLSAKGLHVESTLPTLSPQLASNAALAIACVHALDLVDSRTLATVSAHALARTVLPGRTELISKRPWVIVDSAHTDASARSLADALARLPATRAHTVLSLSSERNLETLCRTLLSPDDMLYVTRADPLRSLDACELAGRLREINPMLRPVVVADPNAALMCAFENLERDELLCVTGSVYMAGLGRSVLLNRLQKDGSNSMLYTQDTGDCNASLTPPGE